MYTDSVIQCYVKGLSNRYLPYSHTVDLASHFKVDFCAVLLLFIGEILVLPVPVCVELRIHDIVVCIYSHY